MLEANLNEMMAADGSRALKKLRIAFINLHDDNNKETCDLFGTEDAHQLVEALSLSDYVTKETTSDWEDDSMIVRTNYTISEEGERAYRDIKDSVDWEIVLQALLVDNEVPSFDKVVDCAHFMRKLKKLGKVIK